MFNTLLFLAILYFWWANRQFHFQKRKKDGSRLSSIATNQDAKELQQLKKKQEQLRRHRRQQRRRRSKQRQRRTETNQEQEQEQEHDHKEDDDDKDDEDTISLSDISEQDSIDQQQLLVEEEEESEATWNLEDADLSDYDTDEDEQEASASTKGASDDDDFLAMLPPDKRRIAKDLTAVVANMEVFSYLSKDAFFQVMEHMEYIDLKQGQQLFSETTLDGSLYAVISGKVKCDFEFQPQTPPSPRAMKSPWNTTDSSDLDDDPSTAAAMMEPLISFTAGDGDIVTSLLTMLLGLVRQCQDRSTPPAAAPEQPQSLDNNNNNNNKLPIVPAGISVRAIGAAENTQIVRVPPQCFLACLDKYPEDVHRIAQTVVARMQRVTIQTVVRCLGLQKEIVRRDPNESTVLSLDQMALHPEAWGRLKAALPSYVPDAAPAKLQQQIMEDAACVATTNVMGRQHRQDATATDAEKDIRQKLLQVGSIVSLPPGATLIQTGSQTEAIYMILHGALDVGMNIAAGSASALNQSARRRASSTGYHPSGTTVRRSIFPPTKQIARTKLQASKQTTGTSSEQATGSKTAHNSSSKTVFSRIYKAVVGETVGRLSVFTGDASIVTIHNNSDWESAILFRIPKSDYEKIISEHPTALTQCLESILGRLMTPIVCLLDWNVEWLHGEFLHVSTLVIIPFPFVYMTKNLIQATLSFISNRRGNGSSTRRAMQRNAGRAEWPTPFHTL